VIFILTDFIMCRNTAVTEDFDCCHWFRNVTSYVGYFDISSVNKRVKTRAPANRAVASFLSNLAGRLVNR